jgi:hypothetical protein
MITTDERIRQRIAQLRRQREQFEQMAMQELAGFELRITELEALLMDDAATDPILTEDSGPGAGA